MVRLPAVSHLGSIYPSRAIPERWPTRAPLRCRGMTSPVEFSFRLTGTGWAEGRIAVGDRFAMPTASYLSDALGDLIRTVRSLLEGAEGARVSWEEEPGEYRGSLSGAARRFGPDCSLLKMCMTTRRTKTERSSSTRRVG